MVYSAIFLSLFEPFPHCQLGKGKAVFDLGHDNKIFIRDNFSEPARECMCIV